MNKDKYQFISIAGDNFDSRQNLGIEENFAIKIGITEKKMHYFNLDINILTEILIENKQRINHKYKQKYSLHLKP